MTTITRTDADVEIDRLFHFMASASTPEARRSWEARWRAAINARNAARTPTEVAEIEKARGLR